MVVTDETVRAWRYLPGINRKVTMESIFQARVVKIWFLVRHSIVQPAGGTRSARAAAGDQELPEDLLLEKLDFAFKH